MKQQYTLDLDDASVWTLVSASPESREQLPYVQECGDFIARAGYETARSGLPSYLIKYTLSGEGRLCYEGQDTYVAPGHFFFIDCRKPQFYQTSPRTGNWRVVWVHFYGACCACYYERFLAANGGSNVGELPPGNGVAENIYRLLRLYAPAQQREQADIPAAARLLDILAECAGSVRRVDTPSMRYTRQIQDYLSAHFHETVTLKTLSEALSLDKFYLQKLFVRETGISPGTYLLQTRMQCAKELLHFTQRPIADVADAVGVRSESYFIRLFRTSEGMTPAAYRHYWQSGGQHGD